METANTILVNSTLIQAITAIVMAAAAVANLSVIYFSEKQYKRRALFDALNQFSSHRKELEIVFKLKDKSTKYWSPEEREAANVICFDLFHIGHLVMQGGIPEDFCELYYYAIPTTREILDEYIKEIRKERHPAYWIKYDKFVEFTKEHNGVKKLYEEYTA